MMDPKRYRNILVFGDSVAYGAGDLAGGWADRLKAHYFGKDFVYNLGISDDTTNEILKRFEFESKQRIDSHSNILLFAVGKNDAILWDNQDPNVSLEQFKMNIIALIGCALKIADRVLFVGLAPIDETKTGPTAWDKRAFYLNEVMDSYNKELRTVAQSAGVEFIDIAANWKNIDYKRLLADGLHPNAEGHQRIFELVKNQLDA